jgi:Zn-dependent protease
MLFNVGVFLVYLGGCVNNLVIAVLCVPMVILVHAIGSRSETLAAPASIFQLMLLIGIQLNVALAAFNLIPLPPLDGSHVMKYLLPPAWSLGYQRLGRYGLVLLFLLISFGRPLLMLWFSPAFALIGGLQNLVVPYIIPSQWTT